MRHETVPQAPSRFRATLAGRRGFALESTLIVMVLISVLVAAAVTSYVMVQKSGSVDYRGTRVAYAAEAGADAVISQLAQSMTDGILSPSDIAAITLPTLSGFTFAAPAVTTVGSPVPRTITNGPFSGLIGLNQQIDIGITATDPANNRAQVVVTANAQSIPLFQFGVFYDGDLEIHNGPNLDFEGWVHTNSNLYLNSGSSQHFKDLITTPDSIFWQRKAYNERSSHTYIDDASGTPRTLNFDSRSNPGQSFVTASTSLFNGRVMAGVSGVQPLKLPLPNGMPPLQLILPRNVADDPDARAVKFSWKATAHITVDLAQLANVNTCTGLTIIGSPLPTGASCAAFTGTPQAFWDGRENIGADVFNIDLAALQLWASGNAARDYSIIYVTFTNYNATNANRDYPVVRISNGATLRAPVTVATDRPIYIRGNFNTIGWRPASFIADAITFQSNAWTDAGHPLTGHTGAGGGTDWTNPPKPNATNTTVYAAVAAGHSATPCDWQRAGCTVPTPPPATGSGSYGGGLENFPRFLENWGGITMTYRGSLVSLFESQYANRRRWSWTAYYDAPTRDWAFDLRFRDPNNLPPGTPVVGSVIQTSFRPVF
ncbi:MAG TPA: hypothetical protein VFV65_08450 [Gemmatimonadales bacterium]|nr:hypothetical protein [Gemmatimonadales bacterium]